MTVVVGCGYCYIQFAQKSQSTPILPDQISMINTYHYNLSGH